MINSIYSKEGYLTFDTEYPLATKSEYMQGACIASIFEALQEGDDIELAEGIFILDADLNPHPHSNPHAAITQSAFDYGKERHPNSPLQRHAAFVNSVAYLVTGTPGKYGGPSVREHSVIRAALSGDSLLICQIGNWKLQKAMEFAEPLCYGRLKEIHQVCFRFEACFDDAPQDIADLKQMLEPQRDPVECIVVAFSSRDRD